MSVTTITRRTGNRAALAAAMNTLKTKNVSTPGDDFKVVSGETKTVVESIKENSYGTEYIPGRIHIVMPLGDRLMVSVKQDPEEYNHEGDSSGEDIPVLFNSFGKDFEEVPLLQTLIPLINLDLDITPLDLYSLIGRRVKVKCMTGMYALEAELVSALPRDYMHESQLMTLDLYRASDLNLDPEKFLLTLGYSEEAVKDIFKLKGKTDKGVIRFPDEAYWDQDVPKVLDLDIILGLEETPSMIIGRNFLKMKTQLCHMPVLMFSGK